MSHTFISRLLTTYRQTDEELRERLGATLFEILRGNGYGKEGQKLKDRKGDFVGMTTEAEELLKKSLQHSELQDQLSDFASSFRAEASGVPLLVCCGEQEL